MKNAFDGYLYHIVRYKKLKKGQKLHFGGELNCFCKNINSQNFVVEEKDINMLTLNKDLKDFNNQEEKTLKSYIYESCLMIRELVLENVRMKEFPNLPSRLECLYCAETLEEAKKWVPILLRMNKAFKPLQIVKLKAKGILFKGDGSLMLRNTNSIDSKIEMARKYWGQKTISKDKELLFIGNVEVIDIIEDLVK